VDCDINSVLLFFIVTFDHWWMDLGAATTDYTPRDLQSLFLFFVLTFEFWWMDVGAATADYTAEGRN
jgi:hypothetical protein